MESIGVQNGLLQSGTSVKDASLFLLQLTGCITGTTVMLFLIEVTKQVNANRNMNIMVKLEH